MILAHSTHELLGLTDTKGDEAITPLNSEGRSHPANRHVMPVTTHTYRHTHAHVLLCYAACWSMC